MEWETRNLSRERAYGKRIGDIVQVTVGYKDTKEERTMEVVGYCSDNNRLQLRDDYGYVTNSFTAEQCKLVTKVEDIKISVVTTKWHDGDRQRGVIESESVFRAGVDGHMDGAMTLPLEELVRAVNESHKYDDYFAKICEIDKNLHFDILSLQ